MNRAISSQAALVLSCVVLAYPRAAYTAEAGPPRVGYSDDASVNEAISAYLLRSRQENRSIQGVLEECRQVIDQSRPFAAQLAAIRQQYLSEPGHRLHQQERSIEREILGLPWYHCLAALHLIGESRNETWIPVLDDLFGPWKPAINRPPGMRSLHERLEAATIKAYYDLVFGALRPHELVGAYRRATIESSQAPPGEDAFIMRARARGLLVKTILSEVGWSAEVLALFDDPERAVRQSMPPWLAPYYDPPIEAVLVYLRQLDHPNPEIRQEARIRYAEHPRMNGGRELTPMLLYLLSREDLSPEGRQNIEDAIRVRGYIPVSADGRLIAVPESGGPAFEAYSP
jgi:hypothetical protein